MSYRKENLFLSKAPYGGIEKIATTTLGHDGDSWDQEISQSLHKEHPYLQEHDIQIQLTNTDPNTGAGIGAIHLDNKIVIPIIIDKFRLAPLDLFWHENNLFPLTRGSLEAVLQDTDIGQPILPGQGETVDSSLYSKAQPPFDGKYTYASLAAVGGPDKLADLLNETIKEASLTYELKTNSVFKDVVAKALAAPVIKTAAKACATKKLKVRTVKPFSKVASHGVFEVVTHNRQCSALSFNHVIALDGRDMTKVGMLVSVGPIPGYSLVKQGSDIAGRELPIDDVEIPSIKPTSASRGVFFKLATKEFICTEPLKIEVGLGKDAWLVADSFNQMHRLEKVAGIKAVVADDRCISLPSDWHWLPISSSVNFVNTEDAELIQKHASPAFSIIHANSRFTVRGLPNFPQDGDAYEKTASSLVNFGFNDKEVKSVLSAAATEGKIHLCYDSPIAEVNKYASAKVKAINLAVESTHISPCSSYEFEISPGSSIKVAAVDDDRAKQTVDTILGLGFISPENTYRFVDKLPLIKDAKEVTAKLLLASRLGLDVDSRPLRTAMFALDSVERDLRELQNAVEVQEQES